MNRSNSTTGQVYPEEIVLTGSINAQSVLLDTVSKWGKIIGDINDQTDLVNKLKEKQDSDATLVGRFFIEKPEYNYRFLVSMAGRRVDEVKDYFQLIIDDFIRYSSLWVPYDVARMCIILKVNSQNLSDAVRFFVPATGEIGFVDLGDESGIVRFTYRILGDDFDESAQWGKIIGSIEDQEDLMRILDLKLNKTDYATDEEIHDIFD